RRRAGRDVRRSRRCVSGRDVEIEALCPGRLLMNREVKTLCPYCGVGCGLIATTNGPRLLRVRGDPDHPANFGKICQKGATVAMTVHAATRLHYPMIRDDSGVA